jgi:hypothetical protein
MLVGHGAQPRHHARQSSERKIQTGILSREAGYLPDQEVPILRRAQAEVLASEHRVELIAETNVSLFCPQSIPYWNALGLDPSMTISSQKSRSSKKIVVREIKFYN